MLLSNVLKISKCFLIFGRGNFQKLTKKLEINFIILLNQIYYNFPLIGGEIKNNNPSLNVFSRILQFFFATIYVYSHFSQ
jgi:hypothetical protein